MRIIHLFADLCNLYGDYGNVCGLKRAAEKFYIYHRKEKSPVIEQRQVRQPLQNHVAILPKYSVSEFMGYFREKSKPPPPGGGFFSVGRARSLRGGDAAFCGKRQTMLQHLRRTRTVHFLFCERGTGKETR